MKIKPYPKNAKKHPQNQLKQIAKSIKEFGWQQPIVVDKQGVIIVGHGRWFAWERYGEEMKLPKPVIKTANLTKQQAKAYRLADNKLNESDWDMDLAIEELKGLDEHLFELTGFDADILIEPDEMDDIIPDQAPAVCKKGDIWQLGRHRVMCGDSTKREDVERLMDGKKADMVFTDPPYGIDIVKKDGNVGGNRTGVVGFAGKARARVYESIIGDDKPFNPTFLLELANHLIVWGANNFASLLPNYSHWLVWDKKGEMQLKNDFSDCELAWTNFPKKTVKKYIHTWAGMTRKGSRKEELKQRVHPTQKPVGLFVDIFQDYTNEDWILLDPFIGSGSTLIACEKTNRICYGMEIDPKYCDVIIKRYEQYTNNKARKS